MKQKPDTRREKPKKDRGPSNFARIKVFLKVLVYVQEGLWLVFYSITLLSLIYICSSIVFYVRHEGYNSPSLFRDWSRIFQSQSLEIQLWVLVHTNVMIGFTACLAIWGEPPSRTMRYRATLKVFRVRYLQSDK